MLSLRTLVDDFFQKVLHMDYKITYGVAHRLGKPKKDFDLPVVVRLNDPKDIWAVLTIPTNLKMLKTLKVDHTTVMYNCPRSYMRMSTVIKG